MPADLSDLLSAELVAVDVQAATKKALLGQIGQMAGAALGLDPGTVTAALVRREKEGSTGMGGGVAIPHARVDGLDRIVAMAVRLAQPIAFDAVDEVPVDLAIALLSPPTAGAAHLKALARVAQALRDRPNIARLRGAGSRDAVWALLTQDEPRDAA